jgi:putative addiction module component (TIGR02574 family)
MTPEVSEVLDQALALPPDQRAVVAERLLSSLDTPDPEIDRLWAEEAERRIAAYEAGAMTAIPLEDVLAELDQE